jgi:hypothetical protein
MTKHSLNPGQRLTVEVIEKLSFGRIEQLSIRDGEPYYDRAPRIVQEIKLGSEHEWPSDLLGADLTLKKEFESLFGQLSQLRDGMVDIEVRHGLPFRLVLERRYTEMVFCNK